MHVCIYVPVQILPCHFDKLLINVNAHNHFWGKIFGNTHCHLQSYDTYH